MLLLITAEIVRILYKEQIRFIKSENQWPFKDKEPEPKAPNSNGDQSASDDDDDDDDLFQNPNRPRDETPVESSTESDSDE